MHHAPFNTDAAQPPVTARVGLTHLMRKQILPVSVMILFGALFWDKAAGLDVGAIAARVSAVGAGQWVLALLATCGSFWAVGRYDAVLHAQLETGLSKDAARRAGITAIGLSQASGFGALTGTLIRWRMLPELTLWQAARLSAAVALSFLAGWACITALAVLIIQPDIPWMTPLAVVTVCLACGMICLSVFPPARFVRLPWPTVRTIGAVVALAAMDTLLAGGALYVLFPPDIHLEITRVLCAYLFALGAGLIGATPGGLGPFEAALASLLPDVPLDTLLGAVVAYRLVYYAIPAVLAAIRILGGPRGCNLSRAARITKTARTPYLTPTLECQIFDAARAEANLLRTRDFALLNAPNGQNLALAAPIGQSLVMLSDPLLAGDCPTKARTALTQAAKTRHRIPAIYKCGARTAVAARTAGWAVLPTAQEAWLDPAAFTLDGSSRRQLRRQLRKASDAGVTVTEGGRILPLKDMDRVAAEWKCARGSERGF